MVLCLLIIKLIASSIVWGMILHWCHGFLEHLPRLQPRPYSVCSSQHLTPGRLHIVFNVVDISADQGRTYRRHGVCTGWLDRLTGSRGSEDRKQSASNGSEGSESVTLIKNDKENELTNEISRLQITDFKVNKLVLYSVITYKNNASVVSHFNFMLPTST